MKEEYRTLYWAMRNSRDRIIGAAFDLGGDLDEKIRERVNGLLKDLDECSKEIYKIDDDA